MSDFPIFGALRPKSLAICYFLFSLEARVDSALLPAEIHVTLCLLTYPLLCFLKLLLGLHSHPSISSWLFSLGLVIMEKWTFIFSLELSCMDKWVAATRMCVLGVLGCYLLLCAGWPRRSLCVPGKRLRPQHSAQGLAWSWCSVSDCGINHWMRGEGFWKEHLHWVLESGEWKKGGWREKAIFRRDLVQPTSLMGVWLCFLVSVPFEIE